METNGSQHLRYYPTVPNVFSSNNLFKSFAFENNRITEKIFWSQKLSVVRALVFARVHETSSKMATR